MFFVSPVKILVDVVTRSCPDSDDMLSRAKKRTEAGNYGRTSVTNIRCM